MEINVNEYLKSMQFMDQLVRMVSSVYPDKFMLVCKKHGIDERDAMTMYSYLQNIKEGQYWLVDALTNKYLESILTLAKEAYASYMNNCVILRMVNFGDVFTKILVIFDKDGKYIQQEFDLKEQRSYVDIADFIANGYNIMHVIRQADKVDSINYVGEKKENQYHIPVYDGDVILCYIKNPGYWRSDWKDCGLYICKSGSYHRLLYTPNKGYIRKGEPDVDEDFELDIEENAFSSYIMTLSQSWYKLGNVYSGIGFLIENPK